MPLCLLHSRLLFFSTFWGRKQGSVDQETPCSQWTPLHAPPADSCICKETHCPVEEHAWWRPLRDKNTLVCSCDKSPTIFWNVVVFGIPCCSCPHRHQAQGSFLSLFTLDPLMLHHTWSGDQLWLQSPTSSGQASGKVFSTGAKRRWKGDGYMIDL